MELESEFQSESKAPIFLTYVALLLGISIRADFRVTTNVSLLMEFPPLLYLPFINYRSPLDPFFPFPYFQPLSHYSRHRQTYLELEADPLPYFPFRNFRIPLDLFLISPYLHHLPFFNHHLQASLKLEPELPPYLLFRYYRCPLD